MLALNRLGQRKRPWESRKAKPDSQLSQGLDYYESITGYEIRILRARSFFGTSENAVKTQIWIAIAVYVLVAIVRKRLKLDATLYRILQILSVIPFEKTPILQALQSDNSQSDLAEVSNQLILFDL